MATSRIGGFRHTTRIEDALERISKALGNLKPNLEAIPIGDVLGRILGEDVTSPFDVPSYNKSAVDGYALVAEDTFGSSQTSPAELQVIGEISAGSASSAHVGRKEAVQVATGAQVPDGADAVVMVEHTRRTRTDTVHAYSPVVPYENVVKAGDDIRKGSIALRKGMRIEPPDIGMLVALGFENVQVAKKPVVGILSTGEELVLSPRLGGLGKTVDVNRPILSNFVKEHGGTSLDLGIAHDNLDDIGHRIREGLEKCDLILVSAGTSVGKADLVPEVINSLGTPGMLVHGISMRPGMPAGLAVVNGKPIISLPGHPVAAIVGFNIFALPMMHQMLGSNQDFRILLRAKLTRRIQSSLGMRTFARVLVKKSSDGYVAEPVRTLGSSILSTMTKSNGIVAIHEEREGIEAGAIVEVDLFRPIEKEKSNE